MITKHVAGALFGLFLLAACSSVVGGATPEAACDQFTNTICKKIKTCQPETFNFAYTDLATCVARTTIACKSTLAAKGTADTPSSLQACTGAYDALSCDRLVATHNPPTECKPLVGPLADGSSCQEDSQCKSTYCKFGTNAACGACGVRVGAGQTCAVTKDCEYGLVCASAVVGTTVTSSCVRPGVAGASCGSGAPCERGLYCNSGTAGTTGTCALTRKAGESCTGGDCDSLKLLACNTTTKVCQTYKTAAAGSACGLSGADYTLCQGLGATCATAGTSLSGTCTPGLADGAACTTTTGASCQFPATCVSGVCTLPTACGG